MFEKIGRVAETMATRVSLSRRGFLDRLGQGALAAIGLVSGTFVFSRVARGGSSSGLYCCKYQETCYDCYKKNLKLVAYVCYSGPCPSSYLAGRLTSQKPVSDCTQCP